MLSVSVIQCQYQKHSTITRSCELRMRAHGGWSSIEAQQTLKAGAAVQQAPKATWLRVVLLLLPFKTWLRVVLLPPFNLRSASLTRTSDCKGTIFATPSGATPSVSFDGLKKNMAQFAILSLPHPTPHLTRSMKKIAPPETRVT
jgi:hypothetical protein